jgi:hypothetical protein
MNKYSSILTPSRVDIIVTSIFYDGDKESLLYLTHALALPTSVLTDHNKIGDGTGHATIVGAHRRICD